MKTKKKFKFIIKRFIKLIIFIGIIYCIFHFFINDGREIIGAKISSFINNEKYKTIKLDKNPNYSGIGQESVKNKDGYFTQFTTLESNKKTYKEYKQNGHASWSNNKYWGGTMEENGCGITAIATIISGYNKNYTPEDLRKMYYPFLNSNSISKELSSTFGIKNSDFYFDEFHFSEESLKNHLSSNRPVLICVWNKPHNNRWTTASHYMVLLATDGKDMVYVSNPNGLENNSKSSGWYKFSEITPYIAKALYIESY